VRALDISADYTFPTVPPVMRRITGGDWSILKRCWPGAGTCQVAIAVGLADAAQWEPPLAPVAQRMFRAGRDERIWADWLTRLLALWALYAIWTLTPPDLPLFQPG
jgi:hypothetical protein